MRRNRIPRYMCSGSVVCVWLCVVLYGFLSHFYLLNIMMHSSPAFSRKKNIYVQQGDKNPWITNSYPSSFYYKRHITSCIIQTNSQIATSACTINKRNYDYDDFATEPSHARPTYQTRHAVHTFIVQKVINPRLNLVKKIEHKNQPVKKNNTILTCPRLEITSMLYSIKKELWPSI